MSPKLSARLDTLTLTELITYGRTQERWLWVCDNILDPLDLPRSESNVNRVEQFIWASLRVINTIDWS